LNHIPHIINIQLDLIFTVLLVLINGEYRLLKSIFQKKLCLTVDMFKEGFLIIGVGTLGQCPILG